MKILVTGGAGFIGSNFIKYILNKYPNYKIINLDILSYCGNLENLKEIEKNPNYSFVLGDICDKKLVYSLVCDVDWIVNFAAQSHVDNSIKTPEVFIKTNIEGTLNLLQASRKSKIKRFLQISTDEVYGSIDKGCFDENSPLSPSNPYAASKAGADLLVCSYYKTYNLPAIITRSSNNFGPNQYPEKLIPYFIYKLLKNEKIPVYGDGKNVRDWIFVNNHIEALDIVLHNGKIGEIYNISAKCEKTNLEIVDIILKKMKKDKTSVEFTKDRLGHDNRYSISNDKIKELGWKPSLEFEKNINNPLDWNWENIEWLEKSIKIF